MPIADVDVPLVQGETIVAVHLAAAEGNLAVLEGLVRVGAKIDQANEDGDTAAHLAAFNGHVHILEVLIYTMDAFFEILKPVHECAQQRSRWE